MAWIVQPVISVSRGGWQGVGLFSAFTSHCLRCDQTETFKKLLCVGPFYECSCMQGEKIAWIPSSITEDASLEHTVLSRGFYTRLNGVEHPTERIICKQWAAFSFSYFSEMRHRVRCPCAATDFRSYQVVAFLSVDALNPNVLINVAKVRLACWLLQREAMQKLHEEKITEQLLYTSTVLSNPLGSASLYVCRVCAWTSVLVFSHIYKSLLPNWKPRLVTTTVVLLCRQSLSQWGWSNTGQ